VLSTFCPHCHPVPLVTRLISLHCGIAPPATVRPLDFWEFTVLVSYSPAVRQLSSSHLGLGDLFFKVYSTVLLTCSDVGRDSSSRADSLEHTLNIRIICPWGGGGSLSLLILLAIIIIIIIIIIICGGGGGAV
jgi:hypothetical protein